MAVLIGEIGRWGRLGLQIQGVKPRDLPDALDVRPKPETAPERVTDLADPRLAAFFARHV